MILHHMKIMQKYKKNGLKNNLKNVWLLSTLCFLCIFPCSLTNQMNKIFILTSQNKFVRIFLKKISTAGIKKVFCGHYHRNAGGFWTSTEDSSKKVECIVSSAVGAQLGDDASGIRIVKVDDNEISHQYYSIDKIPQKIFL